MENLKSGKNFWFWSGFLVFIVLPALKFPFLTDHGYTPRWIVSGLFLSVVSLVLLLKKGRRNFLPLNSPGVILPVLMLVWMAITIRLAYNPGDAWSEFLRIALLLLVFWMTWYLTGSYDRIISFIRQAPYAVFVLSIYGVIQIFPVFRDWIYLNKKFLINLSIGSSLGNKNFFAEVLVALLPFCFFAFQHSERMFKRISFVAILVILIWVILLKSISAWMAAGGILIVYSFLKWKYTGTGDHQNFSARKIGIVLALGLVVMVFVAKPLINKSGLIFNYLQNPASFETEKFENNNSVYERLLAWKNSYLLIKRHPVFGAGLNNWKIEQNQFGIGGTAYLNTGNVRMEHPHNDYLLIWSEQGLAGLLIYLALFAWIFFSAIRFLRTSEDAHKKKLVVWMISGVFAFLILSLWAYPRSKFYVHFLVMIQAGIICGISVDINRLKSSRSKLMIMVCLLISVLSATAAAYRMKGEYFLKKVKVDQLNMNFRSMSKNLNSAKSWWYPLDETATPLNWYRGLSLFYSGNINDAKVFFKKASLQNPWHVRVLQDLGTCYEQMGQRDEAIRLYLKCLAITPGLVDTRLNLSAAYYNDQQFLMALRTFSKAKPAAGSDKDRENYKKFLDPILKAGITELAQQQKDSLIRTALMQKADDPQWYRIVLDESEKNGLDFESYAEQKIREEKGSRWINEAHK